MSVPVSRSAGSSIEVARPRRPTPVEVRRTRRWLLLFLLTPVLLILISWLVIGTNTFKEPVVPPLSTPKGYTAITDAYYGYSVPSSYKQNATWTDDDGDFFYGTTGHGWVAETMLIAKHSPTASTAPPSSFKAFAEYTPSSYTVSGGHPVTVANAQFAYEVDISRPGGWHAVAVDSWLEDSSTQMWLLIKAPPTVTSAVIASLRGS